MIFDPPIAVMIGHAVDRFALLVELPPSEPSPVVEGATPAEWAQAAGLGCDPHASIATQVQRLEMGRHNAETVAHAALQSLCHRARTERVGGLPLRYRPLVRNGRR